MIRNALKKASLIALLPALSLYSSTSAAVNNYENTWFEIEVILFKQIGDKSQLQEVFPETKVIPAASKVIDLLGPYLDPNIAHLKNRIAICPEFIASPSSEFTPSQFTIEYPDFEQQLADDKANNFNLFNQSDLNIPTNTALMVDYVIDHAGDNMDEKLVEAAHKEVNKNVNQQSYTFIEPTIPQAFCIVPEAFFDEYKQENPYFSYNGSHKNIPTLITGEEDFSTDTPYFINEESLQLHDIVKQLKRSRNFKPLLHLGWRQITKGPKEAIPLRLYAGENLIQPYYDSLAKYKEAVKTQFDQQESIQLLKENSNADDVQLLKSAVIKNKIADILQQAKSAEPTIETLLNEINEVPTHLINPVGNAFITGIENTANKQLIAPQKPPLAWTIEGLLKVEVEHFLHVTADFNVINMSLAEQATKQLGSKEAVKFKAIKFEQNKRVRSKEIHYFDHPYMGIIIQIRRHEQVAPIENVPQEAARNVQ